MSALAPEMPVAAQAAQPSAQEFNRVLRAATPFEIIETAWRWCRRSVRNRRRCSR
jgi:phosphoadenosine phosphosulfate reductase